MAGQGGGKQKETSSPLLVPVLTPGEVPADLAARMMKRYGGSDDKEPKLTRKALGLDEATFRKLDTDGDGVLDAAELGGFVKRAPDIEFVLRLGKRKDAEPQLEVVTGEGRSPLADKCSVKDALALLELGLTRAELRHIAPDQTDRITLMRQDYLSRFREADTKGDGVVDEAAVKGNQRLNRMFKILDRDGDGKLTEKKLNAYFDYLQELEKRVAAGSMTLTVSDRSRGLFDLLDTNRDGRLSVREMRQAPKLLKQFDRDNKGYITRADLPRTYRLELRHGAFNLGDNGGLAAFMQLYSGAYQNQEPVGELKGPLWFRKMDRNRDGDVSRKEWLYSEELFKKIDTDGDGLISLEEAEKADALFRKEAEKKKER
jgi:Ca2+-binding EF-hand superfamily protein